MPVDLSASGLPSAYPTYKRRFVPWLVGWILCCAMGVVLTLLLWPTHTYTRTPLFWLCLVGVSNVVFCFALGVSRSLYEVTYRQARYRNQHRQAWLDDRVRYAQQPLRVLGAGYCLPFAQTSLAEAVAGTMPLITSQPPRSGSGLLSHSRFKDDDPRIDASENAWLESASDADTILDDVAPSPTLEHALPRDRVPPVVRIMEHALSPLSSVLLALSRQGSAHAPAVRVTVSPQNADERVQQVRQALQHASLPAWECRAVPADDGLMLADAWLDLDEKRPLLMIAAEWYDTPPADSTEGAVAVLLAPEALSLPESVTACGTLHRPVNGAFDALSDVLANAALWGNTNATSVSHAWISGLETSRDSTLLAALEGASFTAVKTLDAQRRPDPMVGRSGAMGGWLSIAAAVESGATASHLILHVAQTVQAAILYVNPPASHDNFHE